MKKERIKKIVKDIYPYVLVVILVVLVRTFIITPAIVDGPSMEPTLYNKLDYKLNGVKRFDVVVVSWNDEKIIKRVIGLPGEHIEYKKGSLYVDGVMVDETFTHRETDDFKLEETGYITIPGDKYLVVGDNRPDSTDSRVIGLFDKEDILGKVSLRIFPINKIKKIK